ncbi:hypothetical protein EBU94_08005 [bacterium]|nr:hypothetical protein [bacterium]
MQELFIGKAKEWAIGCILGFIASINLLFDAPNNAGNIVLIYTVKFFGVIIFSFISGLFTVMAKDYYTLKLKNKIFKKKNYDDNNKSEISD